MTTAKKRKLDSNTAAEPGKRLKMTPEAGPSIVATPSQPPVAPEPIPNQTVSAPVELEPPNPGNGDTKANGKGKGKGKEKEKEKSGSSGNDQQRRRINKLNAPRPFPTVPTSVSATGPRSSHREGTNMICITRKTPLGNYMRRCKNVILIEGYKTLHLSAMGAAIPHLLHLVCALPPTLPFPQDEIRWEVKTGSVEVQDEVIPEDDDEDLTYQTRSKSVLSIIFKVGNGEFEGDRTASRKYAGGKSAAKTHRPPRNNSSKIDPEGKGKETEEPSEIIYEEPEQEYMDML